MGIEKELKVTRKCDVCSKSVAFIQGQQFTEEQCALMTGWFVVTQESLLPGGKYPTDQPQIVPIAKLGCSKHCALQLIHKDMTDLPAPPKPDFVEPQVIHEVMDPSKLN